MSKFVIKYAIGNIYKWSKGYFQVIRISGNDVTIDYTNNQKKTAGTCIIDICTCNAFECISNSPTKRKMIDLINI